MALTYPNFSDRLIEVTVMVDDHLDDAPQISGPMQPCDIEGELVK